MEVYLVLGNGRGWKNFEKHNRASICCFEPTVGRNTDVNDSASEDSEVRGRSKEYGRENTYCLREYRNHHEQNLSRTMNM